MRFSRSILVTVLTAVLPLASYTICPRAMGADAGGDYKILKKAKVGGAGGFDYVFADSDGRRLYTPRSGGRGQGGTSRVDVFDLDTLAPLGSIPRTMGVHGVAVDPKSGHGFASSGPVVMFDTKTLATIKTIDVKGRPDGIFLNLTPIGFMC